MKKFFICMISCMMMFVLNTNAAADATVPLDSIAAVANNEIITLQQLKEAEQMTMAQMAAAHIPLPKAEVLRHQVLNGLIDQALLLGYAKKLNVQVSDEQLNQTILHIAESNHITVDQLRQSVVERGMSYQDYRKQIRDQITIEQLQRQVISSGVTVTDQEVSAFKTNYSKQTQPDTAYRVYDILIPLGNTPSSSQIVAAQKRAQQIVDQLHKGANFQQLAAANSAGQQALQGGDLGWRKLAELPAVFADQVIRMNIGAVSNPVRAANGFHVIKLVDIRNSTKKLTDNDIRQFIYERKFSEQLDAWLQQLRDSSYVKILVPH